MKGRSLVVAAALAVCAALAGGAVAGPFSDVPAGHWAYGEALALSRAGLLRPQDERALNSHAAMSRYDFAVLALEPLSVLERLARGEQGEILGSAALRSLERQGARGRRRTGSAIARLTREFEDVVRLIGEPYRVGLSAADGLAATGQLPRVAHPPAGSAATVMPALSTRLRGARVGLDYRRPGAAGMPLDYAAAARFVPALGTSPGSAGAGLMPAMSDVGLSGVRASVEYPFAGDLRLTVAYEALMRETAGRLTADPTRLGSVGLAYRVSGSADVKVNYGVIARREVNEPLRVQDRLTSAELTVRF